jgi:hypothetical protein
MRSCLLLYMILKPRVQPAYFSSTIILSDDQLRQLSLDNERTLYIDIVRHCELFISHVFEGIH